MCASGVIKLWMVLIKLVGYIAACCLSASPLYSVTLNTHWWFWSPGFVWSLRPTMDLQGFGIAQSVIQASHLFSLWTESWRCKRGHVHSLLLQSFMSCFWENCYLDQGPASLIFHSQRKLVIESCIMIWLDQYKCDFSIFLLYIWNKKLEFPREKMKGSVFGWAGASHPGQVVTSSQGWHVEKKHLFTSRASLA